MKSLVTYIYEMLAARNAEDLKDRIYNLYGKHIVEISKETGSSDDLFLIRAVFDSFTFFKSKKNKLDNLLKYHHYNITLEKLINRQYVVYFEPIISDSASQYVYENFDNVVYHITRKKYLNNILSKGLIPRSAKYRKFTSRIFLFSGKDIDDLHDNIQYIISDMFDNQFDDEPIVLKIDLSYNDIGFYFDSASGNRSKRTFYTTTVIPQNFIKIDEELTNYAKRIVANNS